jgi:hypothetical protein
MACFREKLRQTRNKALEAQLLNERREASFGSVYTRAQNT